MKTGSAASKPRPAVPAPSFASSAGKMVSMRGGSVRKSGPIMAVPKPINLPSRRAENNGFDPNVQLVPGGSWGATGNKQQHPSGANAPPPAAGQKADAAEVAQAALVPRAPWSMQQSSNAAPAPPRPTVTSSGAFDFPKLGANTVSSSPPAPSRFQPAAPPAQRNFPIHSWRDDSVVGNSMSSMYRSDDHDSRPGRYSSNAYQPPQFRTHHGGYYHNDRNRMDGPSAGGGANPFLTRAWAEDDEGEMDFKQPIVIGGSGAKPTGRAQGRALENPASAGSNSKATADTGRVFMQILDPVEEARLLAKKKQLDLERMEQQLLEQQRRADAEAAERERREEEKQKAEAQRRAAEEAQRRAAEERAMLEERRRRAEQERLEELRREEEQRRAEERMREEEVKARKREEERLMYRNQPQLMKQSIEIARQRRQQEEERMEAERKAAAEQKLKDLESRCAQKELEKQERMEREAKERRDREVKERMEREAKERMERMEREARERRDRDAREQLEKERRDHQDALQQRREREPQDSYPQRKEDPFSQRKDQRASYEPRGEPRGAAHSPPQSPRNDWDRHRKSTLTGMPRDNDNRLNSQSSMRTDDRGDFRNSWPAPRRDHRNDEDEDVRGGTFQNRPHYNEDDEDVRGGNFQNRPRKLFDPKQNRFVTEDEEPGFLRREMAQREEAREQAEKMRREAHAQSYPLQQSAHTRSSRPEHRPRYEDRKIRDPLERAALKAEALLERRKREQDRREQAAAAAAVAVAASAEQFKEARPTVSKPKEAGPAPRVRPPPPAPRDVSDSVSAPMPAAEPVVQRQSTTQRPKSSAHINDNHVHPQTGGIGTGSAKRSKDEHSRRPESAPTISQASVSKRNTSASAAPFPAPTVSMAAQPPLKDLDLTFGGELLISNSTIGAGVGGLRFGQSGAKDPWAMDSTTEGSGKDSWDNWSSAAQSALKPAWGVAADITPPAASLNQIMLEEKLAEERQATVPPAASTVKPIKTGTNARPSVHARGGGRGGSLHGVSRGTHGRASDDRQPSDKDRDAEADPNKFASEIATGAADFILGGEDEPGNDKGFAGKSAAGGQASPAMPVYDGAARWEKAVGMGPQPGWDTWSAFSAGDNAFGGRLTNPLGFLPSLPQQPMWSTDGFSSSSSLWGIQSTPATGAQAMQQPAAKQSSAAGQSAPSANLSMGQTQVNGAPRDRVSKDMPRPGSHPQNNAQRGQTVRSQGPKPAAAGPANATPFASKLDAKKPAPRKAPFQKRSDTSNEIEAKPAQPPRRPEVGADRVADSTMPAAATAVPDAVKSGAGVQVPSGVKAARGGHRSGLPRPQTAPAAQSLPSQAPAGGQQTSASGPPAASRQPHPRPATSRNDDGARPRPQRENSEIGGRGGAIRPGRGRGGIKVGIAQEGIRRQVPASRESGGSQQPDKIQ